MSSVKRDDNRKIDLINGTEQGNQPVNVSLECGKEGRFSFGKAIVLQHDGTIEG